MTTTETKDQPGNRPIPSNPDKWRDFLTTKGKWPTQSEVEVDFTKVADIEARLVGSRKATAILSDGMQEKEFTANDLSAALVKLARAETQTGTIYSAEDAAQQLLNTIESAQHVISQEQERY